jgi:hypothetical protein
MWALGRRTALFVVSYAPLAAMFMVLEWPTGLSFGEVARLGAWLAAAACLVAVVCAAPSTSGRPWKATIGLGLIGSGLVLMIGLLHRWPGPMTLAPPKGQASALTSGLCFAVCVLAALIVVALIANAKRAGSVHWWVTDPRDQGGAIAGYLATYLLPLLQGAGGGWRNTTAYAIYLLIVYIIFVRSDNLVLVNPTLYVFGFRIYDAELDAAEERNRRRVLLVMKGSLTRRTEVTVKPLGDNSYLARPL